MWCWAGCTTASPTDPHGRVAFELHGPATPEIAGPQNEFYETYLHELGTYLDTELPPIVLYESDWPSWCPGAYCLRDGTLHVLCHDPQKDCVIALSGAIVDRLGAMPRVFRDALADLLAGGLAHGDYLDEPVDRSMLDLAALLDDHSYAAARTASYSVALGDRAWQQGTVFPAADLSRFIIDRIGMHAALRLFEDASNADAWRPLGGMDAALASWRAKPPASGRSFRMPLAECSGQYDVSLSAEQLPVLVQGVLHAPDLDSDISRFGIAAFNIPDTSRVSVRVTSAIGGQPFARLEACDNALPALPETYVGTDAVEVNAVVPAGRYFLVAGSSTVPTPPLDDALTPEALRIEILEP